MDEHELFQITTKMEKDDYKKYLYFITFRKSYQTMFSLIVLSLIGTFIFSFLLNQTNPIKIISIFLIVAFISLSFLFLKLERQVTKLFPTDTKSSFKKEQTIHLYGTYLTASNRMSDGETKTDYLSFHEIYETAEYLILYFDKTLASPVRKKDIAIEQYDEIISLLKSKLENRYTILS